MPSGRSAALALVPSGSSNKRDRQIALVSCLSGTLGRRMASTHRVLLADCTAPTVDALPGCSSSVTVSWPGTLRVPQHRGKGNPACRLQDKPPQEDPCRPWIRLALSRMPIRRVKSPRRSWCCHAMTPHGSQGSEAGRRGFVSLFLEAIAVVGPTAALKGVHPATGGLSVA